MSRRIQIAAAVDMIAADTHTSDQAVGGNVVFASPWRLSSIPSCRARHERFRESDALRRMFEEVVATCIAAGLAGGEAFSIDASLIKADVDKK